MVEPLIPCFEELTGIMLKTSVLGENQFVSKLPIEFSGGSSTPDVFMINMLGQAQGSGWLETLDPYLNNPKLMDQSWYNVGDFFQGAQDFAKLDGKFTALPITAEAQMLFVRDDLVPTPPKTIDDLIAASAAANKDGVAGFGARAVADANQTPWSFGGFAFSDEVTPLHLQRDVLQKQVDVRGAWMFPIHALEDMLNSMSRQGVSIESLIGGHYDLDHAGDAWADFAAGSLGKTVIDWE